MDRWKVSLSVVLGLVTFGCSSSGGNSTATPSDGGGADSSATDAAPSDAGTLSPTTTIPAARGGNVTTTITVQGVVTAVRGDDPADIKEWYVEDAAGGPNSGIAVYCDHAAKTAPCSASVTAPALHDLVTVSGTITSYKGKLEITPTAQIVNKSNAALPPIPTVMASDLAAGGMSNLRGTLVKLATKVTVDSVMPQSLYYAKCAMADGGMAADGGATLCSGCTPPTWAGFQVNDGSQHELLVENHFYTSEHLQGSPECTSAMGAIPVNVGMTFSTITGILDFNPSGMVQTLSPVLDTDYATP